MSPFRKRIALLCLAGALALLLVAVPLVLVEVGGVLFAIVVCATCLPVASHNARPALTALRASHHLPRASILPAAR
ncbi:MAG TPA: hypothetical protein VKB93_12705 [Thermoanaerobaculia bacterium]|nr:hypothetical protein [Thermoanaerobaculia bacterium]